jgi:hypothetical protein
MYRRPLFLFYPKRHGFRWSVVYVDRTDGVERPMHEDGTCFWRWITAARVASTMNSLCLSCEEAGVSYGVT